MQKTKEVFFTFLKLGLTSFGGPIAHLGYFRKELVERRNWVTEEQYAQLLAICQFLPGPASSQLGFALGLIRASWSGAFAAFIAFTMPSVLLLIIFASVLPLVSTEISISIIQGLKLVAFAVVADAVLSMSRKLCPDDQRRMFALIAAIILLLSTSIWLQIAVVVVAALAGIIFLQEAAQKQYLHLELPISQISAILIFVVFLIMLLLLPLLAPQNIMFAIADAFYRTGALVFGGGHVVLPLLDESVVQSGWLSEQEFLAGYGAAQAIPGPLFSFSAYLGFIIPTEFNSWYVAFIAIIFMFLPGFLLISATIQFWHQLSSHPIANNAIAGINAAVVGILAAALYDPIITSSIKSITDLIIGVSGLAMLVIWRLSPLLIVAWCVLMTMLIEFT
ncbi:MAG: chromate efflux transporter [Pseudomonadota bacterium]